MREKIHLCHALGCSLVRREDHLMCRKHWFMVPPDIRVEVNRHYIAGQERTLKLSKAYIIAATKAINSVALQEGVIDKEMARIRLEAAEAQRVPQYD